MHKLVSALFITTLVSLLSACAAHAPAPTPLPNPSDEMNSFNNFRHIPVGNISKGDPFPDGTARYLIKIPIDKGYNTFQTNSDTKGLELLNDGTKDFSVRINRYKRAGGSDYAYSVAYIKSEILLEAYNSRQRAINLEIDEHNKKARYNGIQEKEATFRSNSCGEAMRWNYFCFDDNSKLNGHDIKAISKLVTDVTHKIVKRSGVLNSYSEEHEPELVGKWYIESVSKDSVNITITHGPHNDIIGETVIDRKARVGSYYYFVRNSNQASSD